MLVLETCSPKIYCVLKWIFHNHQKGAYRNCQILRWRQHEWMIDVFWKGLLHVIFEIQETNIGILLNKGKTCRHIKRFVCEQTEQPSHKRRWKREQHHKWSAAQGERTEIIRNCKQTPRTRLVKHDLLYLTLLPDC